MNSKVGQVAQEMVLLHTKIMRSLRDPSLTHMDLSGSQMIILLSLHDLEECKVSILSKERRVSMPTMTGMIDRLVELGYARRKRSKKDRRAVMVSLTKKGDTLVHQIQQIIRKKWQFLAAGLTESERRSYISILKKLIRIIEEKNN